MIKLNIWNDFKRMIRDVESGRINCIITKDLSRLGRNYSMTGYYTDEYFPEQNVRYIALNDGVDTMGNNNDFAAFHNVINEYYPTTRLFISDLSLLFDVYNNKVKDTTQCSNYQADRLISLGLFDSAMQSISIIADHEITHRYIHVNDLGRTYCSLISD